MVEMLKGGNEGELDVFRNLPERHPDTAVVGFEQLGELLALDVQHGAGAGQLHALEPVVVGQVRSNAVVELDHRLHVERRVFDQTVAAELLVGDCELVEVDAAECADFAGHGLRIGHRGVDQDIEVEVLDVERLAHVRAAVLEELRDLGLIMGGVEFDLQRFRARRHLRQRQRSGKHLDEDQIHCACRAATMCRSAGNF